MTGVSDIVLADPSRLWLLVVVAAVALGYILSRLRAPRYTLRFTQLALLDAVAPRRPRWRRHLVAALTLLGLTTLVFGAARPQVEVPVAAERAAIVVALDTSLSMQATDVDPNRFDVAREAATRFVQDIPQPVAVGLVGFNGISSLQVAPTTDRDRVVDAIAELQLGESTAIGDAVAVSVEALRAGEFVDPEADPDPQSSPARVVLLSDGGNTVGRELSEAVEIATEAGVPVSTIAYGTPSGTVTYRGTLIPVPVDGPALQGLADDTGGRFYEAATGEDLDEVYADIGSTITIEEEVSELTDRFLLVGFALLVAGAVGSLLWFERIP